MKLFIFIISLLVISSSVYGQIYKWTDSDGKVHFSDQRPGAPVAGEIEAKVITYTSVTYDVTKLDHGNKVVMYSTAWCKYCKKARKYFKKNNISFTDYDIEKDSEANNRYKKMGAKGVPVILVGKKRMNGFSIRGFERIYK